MTFNKLIFSPLPAILILVSVHFSYGQEPGFINDPDGYTNIREGQDSKSKIIDRVLDGERFLYFPDQTSSWWRIEVKKGDKSVKGFVHNSRIKPEYESGENWGFGYIKVYHEFTPTASSFSTIKRNISKSDLPEYYFVETIDNEGRVVDIRFFKGNRVISQRLCYLSPWIKYEYPDPTTVVTYNLNSDGSKLSSLECDMNYKSTYFLNSDQTKILKSKVEYDIDTARLIKYGWKKEEILKAIERVKNEQQTAWVIDGFMKSTAKLNGKFPVSEEFKLEVFSYIGLEYEELKKIFE